MKEYELINYFEESQSHYLSDKDFEYLKKRSQFFTPGSIIEKMVETIDITELKNNKTLRLLEPAAGCGILILYSVLFFVKNLSLDEIYIEAYELDSDLFKILNKNLQKLKLYISDNYRIKIRTRVSNKNFILQNAYIWNKSDSPRKFNIIISNPPFYKINKSSLEAQVLPEVVYGQPNIYTLFIGLSLKMLASNGQYVVISPRNYLNGDYSKYLRKYIFEHYSLTNIHSFDKRNIFNYVNQEVIISTFQNNKNINRIQISHNGDVSLQTSLKEITYNPDSYSVFIPRNNQDFYIFKSFSRFTNYLSDLGVKVSVGPVVQFRNINYLSKEMYSDSHAPLLISKDIQDNNIVFYQERMNTRKTHNKSIHIDSKQLINNSNYVLLRKITAKDDNNPIVAAVLERDYFNHNLLGIDNNLLYFSSIDEGSELSLEECYGLYCIINSEQFKDLYLLIAGTHTINVSDFSNIKFPDIKVIQNMGKKLYSGKEYNRATCSKIFSKYFNK